MLKKKIIMIAISSFSVIGVSTLYSYYNSKVEIPQITSDDFTSILDYHVCDGNEIKKTYAKQKVYLYVSGVKYDGEKELEFTLPKVLNINVAGNYIKTNVEMYREI